MEGLLSILKNKCLWLSDASKTNDKTELFWILSDFIEIFHELYRKFVSDYQDEKAPELLAFLFEIENRMRNKLDVSELEPLCHSPNSKQFLCCFSEQANLLSQWIAYADNGYGASIGFDSQYFTDLSHQNDYRFTNVIYEKEKMNTFIRQALNDHLKAILESNNLIDRRNVTDPLDFFKTYQYQIIELIQEILYAGYCFKNEHFLAEEEWRLFLDADDWEKLDFYITYNKKIFTDFMSDTIVNDNFSRSKLKFHNRKDCIVPHIQLIFEKICPQFIKTIYLGPKCLNSELDIKLLLVANGYIKSVNDNSIQVIKSDIPYI